MVARTRLALVLMLVLSFGREGRATPEDFEAWASAMAFIPIEESGTYQLYLETQPRLGDNWQRMATALIRTALVYNPTSALSLFAGYGRSTTRTMRWGIWANTPNGLGKTNGG
jgi:hypothetical protein